MSSDEIVEQWREVIKQRVPCPRCGSARVWHNGVRWRKASLRVAERTEFFGDVPVRRLKCGDCGQRYCGGPKPVVTRAHYQPCVVAHAVAQDVLAHEMTSTQVAREHGCHRRTLRRWIARVAALAPTAALGRLLLAEAGAPVLPRAPLATRPRRSPRLEALGAQAVLVIALLEALASLRGLEPPALAHAHHFVPAVAAPSVRAPGADSDV